MDILHGGDPVQVDSTHPAFEVLDEAFETVVGNERCGAGRGARSRWCPSWGSAGAPVILTGIGLPDDGLHSPNEKLDLQQLWDGIEVFGRFFELFAAKKPGEQPERRSGGNGMNQGTG